jgi:hypothetical protein
LVGGVAVIVTHFTCSAIGLRAFWDEVPVTFGGNPLRRRLTAHSFAARHFGTIAGRLRFRFHRRACCRRLELTGLHGTGVCGERAMLDGKKELS